MRDKIFLIGMPGTGKTTFGMQLAQQLECAFFDLDYEIEREEGKTVSQIFSSDGETYFRELEHRKLAHFIQSERKSFVLATGGGTPCFHDNLPLMLDAGEVVHVFTDIPTLAKRLKRKAGARPLLKGKNLLETVSATWNARKSFYEMANFKYDSTKHSVDDLIKILRNKKGS
ncbi:shikimate kinase [Fulvivirgaceae bacterium LMO-SS25]